MYDKKGFKNFIGYKDNDKIEPFCIVLPKMSGCVKCFDETKCKSFSIEDKNCTAKSKFLIKQTFSNVLLVLRNFFLEIRTQVKKYFARFHDYLFWEIIAKHK